MIPARPSESCPTWPFCERIDPPTAPPTELVPLVDPPRPGRTLTLTDRLAQLDGLRAELDVLVEDLPADVDPLVLSLLRRARGDLDDAVGYLEHPTDYGEEP